MTVGPAAFGGSVLQVSARSPLPDTRTTVGDPSPWHSRYICRPPPILTRPEVSSGTAAWTATGASPVTGTRRSDEAARSTVAVGKEQMTFADCLALSFRMPIVLSA